MPSFLGIGPIGSFPALRMTFLSIFNLQRYSAHGRSEERFLDQCTGPLRRSLIVSRRHVTTCVTKHSHANGLYFSKRIF